MTNFGSQFPLSIAVPAYNRRGATLALVESLIGQANNQDEIIVADDGSIDGTAEELAKISGIRLITQKKNQGMVANWNVCLGAATRDWICVIHDDDILEPNGLNVLRRACAFAGAPALIVPTIKQTDCDDTFRFSYWSPGSWAVLHCPGIPSGAIIHRDIVNNLGLFNARYRYSPDLEYFSRIVAHYPLIILESPLAVRYNLHDSNYQVRTWKAVDFGSQLEDIQRQIVAYAGLNGARGESLVRRRLKENFEYILKEGYRRGDAYLISEYEKLLKRLVDADSTMSHGGLRIILQRIGRAFKLR